jgi:hypothetical protein
MHNRGMRPAHAVSSGPDTVHTATYTTCRTEILLYVEVEPYVHLASMAVLYLQDMHLSRNDGSHVAGTT